MYLQAIEKDPDFALAYAAISTVYVDFFMLNLLPDMLRVAKAAAEKALSLDNTLSEAYVSLAGVSITYEWDWENAEYYCG